MQITRNSIDTDRGPERLVHRRGLPRRGRGAVGRVAAQREQRPLHARAPAPPGTPTRTARRSSCSRASASPSGGAGRSR